MVFRVKGDYVVQVSGSCDNICLHELAVAAGAGCTAKSLGSSLTNTWVAGTCPQSAASSGGGFENIMGTAASTKLRVQSVEADGVFKKNDLWADEVEE